MHEYEMLILGYKAGREVAADAGLVYNTRKWSCSHCEQMGERTMQKPTLIIMAAGLGSRYGGLKQISPVDAEGHIIMDFSVFDARRAGFEDVVFVIKPELEENFRAAIGDRVSIRQRALCLSDA